MTKIFAKVSVSNVIPKKNLTEDEKATAIAIINDAFSEVTESPTFFQDMGGEVTDSFNGYVVFTLQDKTYEIAEGQFLSHFVLTYDHNVIAVPYDYYDKEHCYLIK